MPRHIFRLIDEDGTPLYGEWSTAVDAPVSDLMSLDAFTEHYVARYGSSDLDERMARVAHRGASCHGIGVSELLRVNRAGENETDISPAEILERYRAAPPTLLSLTPDEQDNELSFWRQYWDALSDGPTPRDQWEKLRPYLNLGILKLDSLFKESMSHFRKDAGGYVTLESREAAFEKLIEACAEEDARSDRVRLERNRKITERRDKKAEVADNG